MIEGLRAVIQQDISELYHAVHKDGVLQVVDSSVYKRFNHDMLSQLCVENGYYCLPTTELIEWLHNRIAGRSAIEVGAGCGVVGRALGIKMTDNFQQEMPKYREMYLMAGQQPLTYGKDVLKMDALDAVKRFKPEVVIGCWITHRYQASNDAAGGNEIGLQEARILRRVDEYLVVGNLKVHEKKPLLDTPHEQIRQHWLVSRAEQQSLNVIFSWKR